MHVGADLLTQVGDLVDERNLGREKTIRRVLDQLGGLQRGKQDRRFVQIERPIEVAQDGLGTCRFEAANHPIRSHEILDRRTFAQEFRVRGDIEVGVGPHLAHDAADFPPGADGNGRFCDHDGVPVERLGDLARRIEHVAEIRFAVAPPARRADGNKHRVRRGNRRRQVGGEFEPPDPDVHMDQALQTRLEYRHRSGLQVSNLFLIHVHAGNFVAELRETSTGNQSDIAGTNHSDAHGGNPL